MTNKYINKKAQMSYAQILILVISLFAFSYMIYSIDLVNAQVNDRVCCKQTKSGQSCQFVEESQCKEDSVRSPNECKDTSFCELGCCFSSNNGLCNIGTPKENCNNGNWFDNEVCNVKECERGCCILGSEGLWTTERNCEVEAGTLGFPIDFRQDVNSEISCIFLTEKDDEGACVSYSNDLVPVRNCVYTTRDNCATRTGNEEDFYKNTLCSDAELDTVCESHSRTGCVEEEDEVYWFDSCGNKEEVKEACSIFTGTICRQYRPDIDAEPDEGDYVCRDIGCEVEVYGESVRYENGESWCEYEGSIGEGKDVVGSRHFRHVCFMGEEKIEPCSDYRNQICVQSDSELADGSEFSDATCRVNRWRSCYEYNNQGGGMAQKCEDNPDCYIHNINVDDGFQFDICVPNYPPGFDLKNENSMRNGEMECSLASQSCTVTYVKRIDGWDCESNCNCEKLGFAQQMNDLCTSLGDCGGYVNWQGDYTDDGYSSNVGRINGNQYVSLAEDAPGQEPAEPGSFGFSQILGMPAGLGAGEDLEFDGMLGMIGGAISALGSKGTELVKEGGMAGLAKEALSFSETTTKIASGVGGALYPETMLSSDQVKQLSELGKQIMSTTGDQVRAAEEVATKMYEQLIENGVSPDEAAKIAGDTGYNILNNEQAAGKGWLSKIKLPEGFGDALAGIGAGLSVASFLQAGFGANKEISYTAGGIVGIYVWMNPALWWVGALLSLYSWIAGLGDVKHKTYTFNCYPWQAPTGGDNCNLCNQDNIICSKYKCESLGQTCEFINKGTLDEECIENSPTDVSSPRITPLYELITEGYDYKEVQNNGFSLKELSGSCIDDYTRVEYGIETDKPAQCRIGTSALQDYNEMPEYFGGRNLYLTEHENVIFMPSPEAFKNQYNLTDEQIKDLGEIRFFVKCKSVNGAINGASHVIRSCIKPGPDLTAPRVTKVPENNYIAFNQTEKQINVWVNEPSSCKWSNADVGYEEMENDMTCQTDLEDYGLYGWGCETTLSNLVDDKFYFKCRDISDNGNEMQESYVYELVLSDSELIVEDFKPINNDEIISGVEPVSFDLKVKTAGGVENGKAVCSWEGNGYSDQFIDTNDIYHNYRISSGTRGEYNVDFICEDLAGNIAKDSTSFEIIVDNKGPVITRMYYSNGLKVWTNEEAECRYGFSNRLEWDNMTSMGYGLEHTANWQLKNYYIQCEDEFGNKERKIGVKGY